MTEIIKPTNQDDVVEAITSALGTKTPLEIRGAGSKAALGRPMDCDQILDVSGLSGINFYEPDELVMSAMAGTPMAEIEALLVDRKQMLAFEPLNYGPLLHRDDAITGTIGGVFACNLSGPRRIKAGAARDHLLGFSAVSGRAELFKSGGRVVKNVTGFDLSKLITGSFGTLGIMTEVIFKVMPVPEKSRTILIYGATSEEATAAMSAALGSSHEVASASHLPEGISLRSDVDHVANAGTSVTAIRIEGPAPSVEHRCQALRTLLAPFGETEELHSSRTATLWKEIRDATYFARSETRQIWRVSVPPTDGHHVARSLLHKLDGEVFFDWGGGLIWLAIEPGNDDAPGQIHHAAGDKGGHATLIRADKDIRSRIDVFTPQTGALASITTNIKKGFDPENLLNPGRMYSPNNENGGSD